jgi:tetratricopeptide (TPR) repeat protein
VNGLALLDDAARSAESAIRLEPTAGSAFSLLGKIALHQCQPERAQTHLERAVKMRPDPVDLYYLGLIHYEQDNLDRAIRLVRRGYKLARGANDPRYRTLQLEMEFMLAHAHTTRAGLETSPRDLRKAMRFLDTLRREFPDDEDVKSLDRVIQRLDYKHGPVRRELGIPRGLSRRAYNASLDE